MSMKAGLEVTILMADLVMTRMLGMISHIKRRRNTIGTPLNKFRSLKRMAL